VSRCRMRVLFYVRNRNKKLLTLLKKQKRSRTKFHPSFLKGGPDPLAGPRLFFVLCFGVARSKQGGLGGIGKIGRDRSLTSPALA